MLLNTVLNRKMTIQKAVYYNPYLFLVRLDPKVAIVIIMAVKVP